MGKYLIICLTACLGACFPHILQAIGDEHAQACAKELLLTYFPEPFVKESLSKYDIPSDQREAIQRDLASKDKDVIKMVEEKASQVVPNPLRDPQERQVAIKLFRETLYEVFSDVLKSHGVTDEKQIHALLDDVQKQKAQRFARCLQPEGFPQ